MTLSKPGCPSQAFKNKACLVDGHPMRAQVISEGLVAVINFDFTQAASVGHQDPTLGGPGLGPVHLAVLVLGHFVGLPQVLSGAKVPRAHFAHVEALGGALSDLAAEHCFAVGPRTGLYLPSADHRSCKKD